MKFYIAADDKTNKHVRSLVKKLRTKGLYCVNSWNDKNDQREDQVNNSEEKAIDDADFLLVLLTAGKGNLSDIGYALTKNKKLIVYSPEKDHYHIDKKSIFHNMPNVYICSGSFYKLEKMIKNVFIEKFENSEMFQISK